MTTYSHVKDGCTTTNTATWIFTCAITTISDPEPHRPRPIWEDFSSKHVSIFKLTILSDHVIEVDR